MTKKFVNITAMVTIYIQKKCAQKYIDYCCNYLQISEKYFWEVVDKWVNKKLFKKDENGKWVRKFEVGKAFDEETGKVIEPKISALTK